MIRLDAATVLLQWATGGMAFCWFTTRRREVGLGYGWLLRGIYLVMAMGAFAAGLAFGVVPVREAASLGVAPGGRARPASRARPSHRSGRGDDRDRAGGGGAAAVRHPDGA